MNYFLRAGRAPGIMEIEYHCALSPEVREEVVTKAREFAGGPCMPVVIVDFRDAVLEMAPDDARDFHGRWSSSECTDNKLLIYVTEKHKEYFLLEASIAHEYGRMIEVVDSMDAAYELLESLNVDGLGAELSVSI